MTTKVKINNSSYKRPRILLAPLDWGLGHATRCVPIIKELLSLKCDVIIATSGAQKALLQGEFPFLSFVELTGYQVRYGKNRALTLLKIITLIPEILIRIKQENNWLRQFMAAEKLDAVIADNRYGLHSKGVFSVFMTHQLSIKSSAGRLADRLLQRIHYRAINRFSLCWVPDEDGKNGLAGELSHPRKMPRIPLRYIGILSRFGACDPEEKDSLSESLYPSLLILLSGPEPQRTIFEEKILEQLPAYSGKVILVRGLPGGERSGKPGRATADIPDSSPITIYNHLPSAELNRLICDAGLVICRPGYSSVMDLLKLGKKCVFVPTPGQTEQEYLGAHLAGRGLAICVPQRKFSLSSALTAAKDFSFTDAPPSPTILQKEISAFLEMIKIKAD